jgi:hypothetical protein
MLDPIQYEFRIFQNTLADPEPGAGAETSEIPALAPPESFGSMRLRLHNTAEETGTKYEAVIQPMEPNS